MAATARATTKLVRGFLADFGEAAKVDEFDADQEHDGGEYRVWQVTERPREEEQHQQDCRGGGEVRDLAAPARRIDHGRFGGAAVDDERAAQSCRQVGERRGPRDPCLH